METLVGIFNSRADAERAVEGLHAIGLSSDAIVFLTPGQSTEQLDSVPTTDAEAPGMGEALSGYVGGVADLYLADADGGLVVRQRAMSPGAALSPRALLEALFSAEAATKLNAAKPVPEALGATDILGVRVEEGVATVNLSARFYSLCQELDERRERTAVYAIVNTLCNLEGIRGVRFLIEGGAIGTLAEHIYLRSVLLPSPGLAVEG
jgi:hypothetical protein